MKYDMHTRTPKMPETEWTNGLKLAVISAVQLSSSPQSLINMFANQQPQQQQVQRTTNSS